MVSEKQIKILGAGALVLIAGAFIAPYFGIEAKSSLAGAPGGEVVVTTTGACPSTGLTNLNFKPVVINASNSNTETIVNTTVNIYRFGESSLLASTTSGTSGYSTIGTANCGEHATAIIGDGGSTYYYVSKELTADMTKGANTNVPITLKESKAATFTVSNSSSLGQSAVAVAGVGAGSVSTDATLRVKAGSAYYGDGAIEICARYNTSNISKVSFGADAVDIAADPGVASAAGKQIKCYEVQGDMWNYAIKEFPIVIQATAGVTPVGSPVDIYINDKSAYILNGKAITGYWNAQTNAALGLSIVSQTTAVTVNP